MLNHALDLLHNYPAWSWGRTLARTDRCEDTINQIIAFLVEHGRFPDLRESTGVWLETQRLHARRGKLSLERLNLLDSIPGWLDAWAVRDWDIWYPKAKQFRNTRRRLPTSNELGCSWLTSIRAQAASGSVKGDKLRLLKNLLRGATALEGMRRARWDICYTEVCRFCLVHNRLPFTHGEPGRSWVIAQRNAYIAGTLPADCRSRIYRLYTRFGELLSRPANPRETNPQRSIILARVITFCRKKGHTPSRTDPDGEWWHNMRRRYHKKQLSAAWRPHIARIVNCTPNKSAITQARLNALWESNYRKILKHSIFTGRYPRIPEPGGKWMEVHRTKYNQGKLSPDRRVKLEAIPGFKR